MEFKIENKKTANSESLSSHEAALFEAAGLDQVAANEIKKSLVQEYSDSGPIGFEANIEVIGLQKNTETELVITISGIHPLYASESSNRKSVERKIRMIDGAWEVMDLEQSTEEFEESVDIISSMISGWADRLDVDFYIETTEKDKLDGNENTLSELIFRALIEPTGETERVTDAGEMKKLVDLFKGDKVVEYLKKVSEHADSLNISNKDILSRMDDLREKLDIYSDMGDDE